MVQASLNELNNAKTADRKIEIASGLMLEIRENIPSASQKAKMALFDLSNKTEELIFKELTNWKAETLKDILMKNYVLARAACGAGYMELWEWEKIESTLNPGSLASVNISALNEFMNVARGTLE